jgi:hypothetical protein
MAENKLVRVIVRALETRGYRYQIFTFGSPRPSQSDNVIYATRDAERAGQVAAAILGGNSLAWTVPQPRLDVSMPWPRAV